MLQNYINSSPATVFVGFVFCSFFQELLKHILYIFFSIKGLYYLSFLNFFVCFANVIII